MSDHHWLTIHRVRFAKVVGVGDYEFPSPAKADCWRFGLDSPLGENGLRQMQAEIWGGIGIFNDRRDAEAVVEAPNEHLPFVTDAIEEWHALAIPFSHHGPVNWRGFVENGTAIRVTPQDPGGPLVVLTTAAYNAYTEEQMPRIVDFLANGEKILRNFETLPGNVRRCLFISADERDGITCSLWKDDAAMLHAVYGSGVHREQMLRHANQPVFDRSCFTRARIITSKGTWAGSNPVNMMASSP